MGGYFRRGLLHSTETYAQRDLGDTLGGINSLRFASIIAFFCLAPLSWGALIDTSVTGSLLFNGNPNNFFDPANGFVPARFENANGTTVTIEANSIEFGFNDGANRDTANFKDGELVIRDRATGRAGGVSYTLTFTDPAFAGITLVSSTFSGLLDYDIVGDEIEISVPQFSANGRYKAVFDVASTPEPGSCALIGLGMSVLALVSRKFRER